MNRNIFRSPAGKYSRRIPGNCCRRKAGFDPIKINTVVLKGFNDDEVLKFVELAMNKPFSDPFYRNHADQ